MEDPEIVENVLGPCRLPYELIENNKSIDSGYLLSPRDLCSLEHIPDFINSGVDCLKIEGRMKAPEYVATVTRIYRKYIWNRKIDKFHANYQISHILLMKMIKKN